MEPVEFISLFVFAAISFGVAEIFGRSKHIGRWWTFFLFAFAFVLPGIIALIVSPKAEMNPIKPNRGVRIIGILTLIFCGLLPIIPALLSGAISSLSVCLSFIIIGVYLIMLGKGKVINKNPKYYFSSLSSNPSIKINQAIKEVIAYKKSIQPSIAYYYYYLVENGVESEPYTYDQLKNKRLNEDDLVWRKGLESWVAVKELPELDSLIIFSPPPIPKKKITEQTENTEGSVSLEKNLNDVDHPNEIREPLETEKKINKKTQNNYVIFLSIVIVGAGVLFFSLILPEPNENISEEYNPTLFEVIDAKQVGQDEFERAVELMDIPNQEKTKIEEAISLLELSGEMGYLEAYGKLGEFFYNKKNYENAFKYQLEGCYFGLSLSCQAIGWHYENGVGVLRSSDRAKHCYDVANDPQSVTSFNNLGYIFFHEQKYNRAYELFNKAIENGFYQSNTWIGRLYEDELYEKRDNNKAFEHYKLALKDNWRQTNTWESSITNVARCFHFGIGVKQDADSALYYYKGSLEKFPDNEEVKQAIDEISKRRVGKKILNDDEKIVLPNRKKVGTL